MSDAAVIRRLVGEAAVVPLDGGLDHRAYAVGERWIARFGDGVEAEAALLEAIAPRLPLPVPAPVAAEPGCAILERVPGRPLLELPRPERGRYAPALREFVRALHALDVDAPVDDAPPEEWLEEARATWEQVRSEAPGLEPRLVAPPPAEQPVFIHGDLGAEHIFVHEGRVSGVIDWGDAAYGDPAIDHGRLLRDVGPAAGAGERARFYALCTAIEDLAFGLETGRDAYRDNALEALAALA